MKIKYVEISNFRKLKSCRVELDNKQTIFVGANNSGKTSAMDAMILFLKKPKKFTTMDFTVSNWPLLNEAAQSWMGDAENPQDLFSKATESLLPSLDIWIEVEDSEIYYVSHLIPTLNWSGGLLGVRLFFQVDDFERLYGDYVGLKKASSAIESTATDSSQNFNLWPKSLRNFLDKNRNLEKYFKVKYYLLDPSSIKDPVEGKAIVQSLPINSEPLEVNPFKGLFKIDIINAQRGFSDSNSFDDEGAMDSDKKLSSQLQAYYKNHLNPTDSPDIDDLDALKAIANAKNLFDEKLKESFKESLGELESLGYPGFSNPSISITSQLDPIDTLSHDASVLFNVSGDDAVPLHLPEKYNGLGYQNLVSMVFKLIRFRDEWQQKGKLANKTGSEMISPLHLVLIEEPEAHLHPQVQQVFIKKAYEVLRKGVCGSHTTQMLVSSHSSSIAHEVSFSSLRYFRRQPSERKSEVPSAIVVNLSEIFGSKKDATSKFVSRYLKTTHCDLFFADAVILVEGAAERMLVPHFIRHHHKCLDTRYIGILEIGGSHAHRLQPLIEKLGILTFVIADIDSKGSNGQERPSPTGSQTTKNSTLSKWVPQIEDISTLLDLDFSRKVTACLKVRVGYQYAIDIDVGGQVSKVFPYTFEDALVLSNLNLFREIEGATGLLGKMVAAAVLSESNLESSLNDMFEALKGNNKAAMALEILYMEDPKNLSVPEYIKEGLMWLEKELEHKSKDYPVSEVVDGTL